MTARSGGDPSSPLPALRRLASRHGVEPSYLDAFGARRDVSDETLVGVLQALGEPISSPADAIGVLDGEAGQLVSGSPSIPAVVVAWDGELPPVEIGPADVRQAMRVELALEDGGDAGHLVRLEIRGTSTVVVAAGRLPYGIHELAIAVSSRARPGLSPSTAHDHGEPDEVTVISAPGRVAPVGPRAWGLFAPLYGLTDEHAPDMGDLTCLERAGRFAGSRGASYLATLPILADLSRADDPAGRTSPYSPLSRMWWHEGYLDAARIHEMRGIEIAPREARLEGGCVDPGVRSAELHPALSKAARVLHETGGDRLAAYDEFEARRPDVLSYARFRAACEVAGNDWRRWSSSWRHGLIDERALDPSQVLAHAYAQFVTDEQVAAAAASMRAAGCGILLDLPVGCRGDGFDPWEYPESFADGATIGAPPDMFFRSGQDWGFVPLHPEGERQSGYEVTGGALRHLLRHAAALRLDHAMGLARLWWIPKGLSAAEGAYVRYQSDELLALCCLEAWRNDATLIGEDLGTVEESLTGALNSRGIAGMRVAVFDLESPESHPMEPLSPPAGSVALVDTHDTATFAGWFGGRDITERVRLGLLGADEAEVERLGRERSRRTLVDRLAVSGLLEEDRTADPVAVHEALAVELALSEAGLLLVNLEDCLGELDPQNVPGTTTEHANFCRPLAEDLHALEHDERVLRLSTRVEAARAVAREASRALDAGSQGEQSLS